MYESFQPLYQVSGRLGFSGFQAEEKDFTGFLVGSSFSVWAFKPYISKPETFRVRAVGSLIVPVWPSMLAAPGNEPFKLRLLNTRNSRDPKGFRV